MKSSMPASMLAGALFAIATVPALSQKAQIPATGGPATESQVDAREDDDDDGSDFGWVGLLQARQPRTLTASESGGAQAP